MDTKERIIEEAITVLNENFSATFEDIAKNCGINRRTVHRYFKNRHELLLACYRKMMQDWIDVSIKAFNSSEKPLVQLEHLLYAAVDCGIKYIFLARLTEEKSLSQHIVTEENDSYLNMRNQLFRTIEALKEQQLIEETLPLPWIRMLFISITTATVKAYSSGDIIPNDIKKLAWYSFRRSIGIN